MGAHVIRCYLGFPTFRNTAAGEALEREGGRMAKAYRLGHSQMLRGFELLHEAVDAAIAGDREVMAAKGRQGVRRLELATAAVAEIATTMERSRKALAELISEGEDPLALRESYFGRVDVARLYAEVVGGTGGAGDRALWNQVVGAVVEGGAVAGLRVIEKTAWRLLTALREQTVESRRALGREPREAAEALHNSGLGGAVLADLWGALLRQAGYLSLVCEEGTRGWEVGSPTSRTA